MIAYLHGAVDIQSRQQKIEHQTGDAELASAYKADDNGDDR